MVIERGRGWQRTVGPRGDVPRHSHPEYMDVKAHDQELHQQFVIPFKVETGENFDTASLTGGWITVVSDTITVPDWAIQAHVMANANLSISEPSSSAEELVGRITVDGNAGETADGHYHDTAEHPNAGGVSPATSQTVENPGSTITVDADADNFGSEEQISGDLVWIVIFERFD